jgi:hypothetical protein
MRVFKKLRQDHPYFEPTASQNLSNDGFEPEGSNMDENRLIHKLDQRSKELEELLQEGEELLKNVKTPSSDTPSSAASGMESPAKRLREVRDGNDSGFISFSSSIDELSQQLDILSKECQLRHSEGFGTPSHSRTPARVELLAETTGILQTMQEKVTGLVDAHRKSEGLAPMDASPSPSHVDAPPSPAISIASSVCRPLPFDMEDSHETFIASPSVQKIHFHLDDDVPEMSTTSTSTMAWTDFDVDSLPEDGLNALECARSRLQSEDDMSESGCTNPRSHGPLRNVWSWDSGKPKNVCAWRYQQLSWNSFCKNNCEDLLQTNSEMKVCGTVDNGHASPSRVRNATLKAPESAQSWAVQVEQIQHDIQNMENNLLEAEVERKEMCEVLAKQRSNINGIEDRFQKVTQRKMPPRPTPPLAGLWPLPIGKRCA